MMRIDQPAEAALSGDALQLRSLAQDWLRENPQLAKSHGPVSSDPSILAIAAGLAELFAMRRGERPPQWTESVGPALQPIYLLKAAATMRRLRHLCETESPLPLHRRNIFAAPTYLESA